MHTLRSVFRLLALCGYWRPQSWASPFKKFLYTLYTIIVLLLLHTVAFYQIMDITFNVKNQDEFSDNFNFLLAVLISCHKAYSLLMIRGKVAVIIGILEREPFLPGNEEEIEIRTRFNDRAETNIFLYILLVQVSVAVTFCAGLQNIKSRLLPFRIWTPYNYTSLYSYSLTYVQELLAWSVGSFTNVACDSLLSGLLIHINSQIEILGCRLRAIKRGDKESAKSCVRYHNSIYRFATMINKEFRMVIFVQFMASTLVVGFNLYEISRINNLSPRMLNMILYTSCLLMQIFLYCWYGNEVKLKSVELVDVIFGLDWSKLDEKNKKILLMIMRQAAVPIEFSSTHIVSMNLQSFVNSWSSPLRKFLYKLYTAILLLLIYTVTFCQLMDIVVNVKTQDEFSDNFYLLLAMLVGCHKIYSLLAIRGKIATFMAMLDGEPFLPRNEEEAQIRMRFNKRVESNTVFYAILVEATVTVVACVSLFKIESRELPLRMWVPYNYSSPYSYALTYIEQVLAWVAASLIHVACDSLMCGLLFHTYSQIEILGHRLKATKRIGDQNKWVKSCVRYHDRVYRFAAMVNAEFRMVILVQFMVSTLVVCFNLYQLTKTKSINSKMLNIIMYTSCMLTQIFFYCWYGNEVKMKSLEISNVIFRIDWTQLDNNVKRILLMIMRRASTPIEFNSIHVISMNIESFVNLLKTAYSAYNVLQHGEG
ncbi:uncharacterized protein LOC143374903 [Andrena cerasifolii]|uniref:uncharacterized protein LOC143374903 n=1 Tax=Andrena cerasifolii TaxID=2819439 RepID=UPI004037B616